MKTWIVLGIVSGGALGIWVSQVASGLDLVDGFGIGVATGFITALALAAIPWNSMGRREF